MTEDIGAFVPGPRIHIEGRPSGPLAGLTFAVKDLFDIAGVPTGGGNHDWPTGRPIPTQHAWAVQALLDGGATLIGKTITDEVSLGILGENAFDGTPINVRAPGRVAGGSSSGSPPRLPLASAILRLAPIRVARCACQRASAAFMESGQHMEGSTLPV